jgi:ubiquinone/menaquinone biosynthesis C-methylase UbiE
MADEAARQSSVPVELVEDTAEAIPIEAASIDTVLTTWTMCSFPDLDKALEEMRRVLKPNGRLLFVEHGLAPEPRVAWWQDRLTPVWTHLSGGCHLNRAIEDVIKRAGFSIEQLDKGYLTGPKIMRSCTKALPELDDRAAVLLLPKHAHKGLRGSMSA